MTRYFPQIKIIELVGNGGTSAVYKARQKSVDRVVALKILPLEVAAVDGGIERFERESRTLASLNHPNIVTLYDAGQAGPWCFCIMEWFHIQSFQARLIDPMQKPKATSSADDLALVQLDRPVRSVQPAVRYRGEDEVGKTLTIVGYRCIGDGKTGLTLPPTHKRRGGNNVIDAAGGKLGELVMNHRVLLFDFDDPDNPAGNQLGDPKPLAGRIGLRSDRCGDARFQRKRLD